MAVRLHVGNAAAGERSAAEAGEEGGGVRPWRVGEAWEARGIAFHGGCASARELERAAAARSAPDRGRRNQVFVSLAHELRMPPDLIDEFLVEFGVGRMRRGKG